MKSKDNTKSLGLEAASLGLVPGYTGEPEKKIKKEDPLIKSVLNDHRKKKMKVLEVSTRGFEHGVLQHNMPCPVCLENFASYADIRGKGCFAPCLKCEAEGYVLKKRWF